MRKVYFISGLGADKRAFSLLDLSFCDPQFVNWIKPQANELLEQYALRLSSQINEENPVVVGVSFGGMLATEMARRNPNLKAIIIASNRSANELPGYLRIGKYLPVYKWIPDRMMKNGAGLNWFLGVRNARQKKLISEILADADTNFLRWAIWAILHWKTNPAPANVIHIHGSADKLLPVRFVNPDYTIQGGTHLISLNKPKQVTALLKKLVEGQEVPPALHSPAS